MTQSGRECGGVHHHFQKPPFSLILTKRQPCRFQTKTVTSDILDTLRFMEPKNSGVLAK